MTEGEDASAVSGLQVEHRMAGEVAVVVVNGKVDHATAHQLMQAVRTGLDHTRGGFCVLDLTAVRFLGGYGLSALLKAARTAENRRQPLRIAVDHNRPVVRPLEITGLEEFLALYHSVDEALQA
ncbi:anti-sigma factor antagonist [Nocardia sp. NBC_01329]|uniref:anti-sigma factor antagonist n=1 Tax=Nocardia sp. NBC_01329 TaxID=2903594 RepID=UPI002E128E46|nr:anti-sigma factor antagonist [Nocardia sp. NBC_01329]WSI98647.1 anti-sigma factor antagonist [Nocardia sp. NBC_01329]